VVIETDGTGGCKSNYHTITTTAAPITASEVGRLGNNVSGIEVLFLIEILDGHPSL